jgi:hypothetical protein
MGMAGTAWVHEREQVRDAFMGMPGGALVRMREHIQSRLGRGGQGLGGVGGIHAP